MNRFKFLPHRRILIVDAGSRCLKVLLVSSLMGRLRLHAQRVIGLEEHTASEGQGWYTVLREVAAELGGRHPMAFTVPQHASISQVLDLPGENAREIRRMIRDEITHLGGLSETAMVYDFAPLTPFAQYARPCWVTHAQEADVFAEAAKLEALGENICEITSPANSLIAAYRETTPGNRNALLVDLGASNTVVAMVFRGQGVYTASYAVGGVLFSEIIRKERGCSATEADYIRNTENLLTGPGKLVALQQLVDRWHDELVRILEDWIGEHPTLNVAADSFAVVLGGGVAATPGLLEYLRANSVLKFESWSDQPHAPSALSMNEFAVAYGTACRVIRNQTPSASLMPEELKVVHKEQNALQLLRAGTWMVLLAVALVLGFATWQKNYLIEEKQRLQTAASDTLDLMRSIRRSKLQLAADYESIRPLLAREKLSQDLLGTLNLLTAYPLPEDAWFSVIGDDASYRRATEPGDTNAPAAEADAPLGTSNAVIAEVCIPLDPVVGRQRVSEMIEAMKQSPILRKADILPPDQQRRLVPAAATPENGRFAIALSLRENHYDRSLLTAEEVRRLTAPLTGTGSAGNNGRRATP